MTSQRRIEANRRNALLSTGPRTPVGKARSRMNALRHGMRSEFPLAGMEDAGEYRRLRLSMLRDLAPATPEERRLAEEAILQGWRMDRVQWMEARLIDHDLAEAEGLCGEARRDADRRPEGHSPEGMGQARGRTTEEDRRIENSVSFGAVLHKSLSGPGSPYLILGRLEGRLARSYRRLLAELRQCQLERRAREAAGAARGGPGAAGSPEKKSERTNPTVSGRPTELQAPVSTVSAEVPALLPRPASPGGPPENEPISVTKAFPQDSRQDGDAAGHGHFRR
jgi:hypothetical protein